MKKLITVAALSLSAVLAGCDQGTSGGPGATSPPSKPNLLGQSDDTFSLAISSTSVRQGETKELSVGISRGKNFGEDVFLKFAELPAGVTIVPAEPGIMRDATVSSIALTAAPDAALGDFTVKVSGHPAKGVDAVTEVRITVDKADPAKTTAAAKDVAVEKLEDYADRMELQLDRFVEQLDVLDERASIAEGPTKADLDVKVATAQLKLDAASQRLNELRDASPERAEAAKTALSDAFAALKAALA